MPVDNNSSRLNFAEGAKWAVFGAVVPGAVVATGGSATKLLDVSSGRPWTVALKTAGIGGLLLGELATLQDVRFSGDRDRSLWEGAAIGGLATATSAAAIATISDPKKYLKTNPKGLGAVAAFAGAAGIAAGTAAGLIAPGTTILPGDGR